MGGVLILVKTCISKYGTQVYKKFDFGVIVKIDKQLLKTNSGVFFISTYLPPDQSPLFIMILIQLECSVLKKFL